MSQHYTSISFLIREDRELRSELTEGTLWVLQTMKVQIICWRWVGDSVLDIETGVGTTLRLFVRRTGQRWAKLTIIEAKKA